MDIHPKSAVPRPFARNVLSRSKGFPPFYAGSTILNSNSGWGSPTALQQAFARTYAFTLPLNSADAAILVGLQPAVNSARVA